MDRKRRDISRPYLYIASAMIPCLLVLISLMLLKAVPFGDATILMRDAEIQYIDFLSYLKTVLTGENDFLYSFSKNMGGEIVSLLSYYLMSPFNLLVLFSTRETLPLIFTIVILCKLSSCGLSFFWASSKMFGLKRIHLLFSTAYALMAYNTIFGWNIMWLDGVIMLPLLGLGLHNLWQGKSSKLYVFSIGYSLLTNFYIGYMLCIASVLFCLAQMFLKEDTVKHKCRTFGKFIFASCIGGFSSAFVWLPTFLALLSGRANFDGSVFVSARTFNILGLAGKVIAGASSPDQLSAGSPHIFCGIFTLLLVLVFFLHRGISIKKRLVTLGIFLVLLCSFYFRSLDIIWHGFSPNFAFNFRYAFIFSYVMLMVALYTLHQRESIRKECFLLAGGLIVVMILAVLGMKFVMQLDFVSIPGALISMAVLGISVLFFFSPKSAGKMLCALFLIGGLFEIGANYYLSMDAVVGKLPGLELSAYLASVDRVSPAIAYVKETDSGFYRMEKTFERDHNDAMFYAYSGMSHFSSSQEKTSLKLLEKMGLTNYDGIWAYYNTGSTAGTDALFGIKYVLSEFDLAAVKGYDLLNRINGIGVYQNPNAFSIVTPVGQEIMDLALDGDDYFAIHNQVWRGISGIEKDVLKKEENYTVSLENLITVPLEDGCVRYVRENMELPACIRYEITISQEDPLYFYFTSNDTQKTNVFVNGRDLGAYLSETRWDMTSAGSFAVGETVELKFVLNEDQAVLRNAYFYYEDLAVLSELASAVQNTPIQLTKESSSHLTGNFTAEEGQVLLATVPYDSGWKLYIDGAEVAFQRTLDALMAAPIPAGTHYFEMRFVPRGTYAGCTLSVLALLTTAVWCTLLKKKQ